MSRNRLGRAIIGITGAASLGVACLAATACSSTPDPLADMSAQLVLDTANSNASSAPDLTLDGTVGGTGGSFHAQLAVDSEKDLCQGTLSYLTKGTIAFDEIGSIAYLKPDDAWWTANTGSSGNGLNGFEDGRYFKENLANGGSLTPWCDPGTTISDDSAWGSVTKGQITTFNGVRALPLDGPHGDVIYVTDTDAPEIAGIFEPAAKGNGNSVKFDVSLGAPLTARVPSATQTLNAADFGFTNGLSVAGSLSDLSATMMTKALANLGAATNLTIIGSGTYPKNSSISGSSVVAGKTVTWNIGFKTKQGCAGTVTYSDFGAYKFVVIGSTVYWLPNDQFWESESQGDAAAASNFIGLIGGRYIEGPASDTALQPVAQLCQMPQDMGQSGSLSAGAMVSAKFTPSDKATAPELNQVGKVTTVNGVKVVQIENTAGSFVYLSDTGTLEIAKITQTGSGTFNGSFTFNAGAPVTLTAPPASDTVTASSLNL